MRSYHYHPYHYHARLDLENFAFVALPRVAGNKKILSSFHYHADPTTRDWTWKIYRSYFYHAYPYHAQLDLENFSFVAIPRAARIKKIFLSYHYHADHYHARLDIKNFAFVLLPRVPLPRAAELKKILRSYH